MNELELLEKWNIEAPVYNAWGNYIQDTVLKSLENMESISLNNFIKIPPTPRLKDEESLRIKAFHRNKHYKDPYDQITDKVGIRFVVLNTNAVKTVCRVIDNSTEWSRSTDRDFEREKQERPEFFDYQSVHYIVRPTKQLEYRGRIIPVDTACEIQVRSLLQHAWAETMHDTVYKPKTMGADPEIKRMCAQAIALTEVVDDIYCRVEQGVGKASKRLDEQIMSLAQLYNQTIGVPPAENPLNTLLLDAYAEEACVDFKELNNFFNDNHYLISNIKERSERLVLFRQPAILYVYFLASIKKHKTRSLWPFTEDALSPIYTDLGFALN